MKKTKPLSLILATIMVANTCSSCTAFSITNIFSRAPKKAPASLLKKVVDSGVYGLYSAASAACSAGAVALAGLLLHKAYLRFTKQDEISIVKRQNPGAKEILENHENSMIRVYMNDKKFIGAILSISAACAVIAGTTGYATKLMFENLLKTLRNKK